MTTVIRGRVQSLTDNLPIEVATKGYILVWENPENVDPVFLRDRNGYDLFVWDYVPSLTEVRDKCRELRL